MTGILRRAPGRARPSDGESVLLQSPLEVSPPPAPQEQAADQYEADLARALALSLETAELEKLQREGGAGGNDCYRGLGLILRWPGEEGGSVSAEGRDPGPKYVMYFCCCWFWFALPNARAVRGRCLLPGPGRGLRSTSLHCAPLQCGAPAF